MHIFARSIFKSNGLCAAIAQAMERSFRTLLDGEPPPWARFSAGLCALLVVACGGSSHDGVTGSGGIFGGSGGVPEAVPLAGRAGEGGSAGIAGSEAGGAPVSNACDGTPPGTKALLDDFNDGDSVAVFEQNREAYWFTMHDESVGSIDPLNQFVPMPGGLAGSLAAHVVAQGYTTWGAGFVANISHKEAIRCPYNASKFAGLRFAAHGTGTMRVQLSMPATVDKEYGGTCDPAKGEVCYDIHGTFVTLQSDYRVFELPWSDFQQRNFGTVVDFDSKLISAVQFTFSPDELPIDLWLDDVAFWDGVPTPQGGSSGAGGASGAGGTAGAGGIAGAGGDGVGGANAGQGGT
jgi:hypothetical protein